MLHYTKDCIPYSGKVWWGKVWRITVNLTILPNFSPAKFSRYMVYSNAYNNVFDLNSFILYCSYIGLFCLDANLPTFQWTHKLGNFILDCCIKFDCGSLLQNLTWVYYKAIMSRSN